MPADLGNEICAATLVSSDLPNDSRFALKTSVERIAEEAARLITSNDDKSVTLAIVCDESLKPTPELFLPVLVQALREAE